MGTSRGLLRLLAFLSMTIVLTSLWLTIGILSVMLRRKLRRAWCRGCLIVLGIDLRSSGVAFGACPTVWVANHVSYLDIVAIGAIVDGTFIAKAEVSRWPIFGQLARLSGTMFIERHWRQALIQRNTLAARLRGGESFVLFGEGTSTDGLAVLPLKTSLLSVAEPWVLDRPIAVQPITLCYRRLADGTPIDETNRDIYAWWGEMTLLPHLWRVLTEPGVELLVELGKPVLSWNVTSRKVLGRELRQEIGASLDWLRRSLGEALPAKAVFS